jgi:nucleotide-binding universal stress UspA family protein
MLEMKRILFPCDLTINASKLLPYLLSVAQKYDATVYVVHVVKEIQRRLPAYVPAENLKVDQEKIVQLAKDALNQLCITELGNLSNAQQRIIVGDPASEILKFIDIEGIDLVIMGTYGRKGMDETIFGSVADNVVKLSPVPVMVINPYRIK